MPQHYVDFTEEEVSQWRARYSGLLPRGAMLGNADEVTSPLPLFIDALSSESPLPEAFKQYFEDPFSPITPHPSGQDELKRDRSNSGASVTSTGAAASGSSPDKPRQIKARRGSFIHRMASKGDKATSTSIVAAMAAATASPEATTTPASMPLPVPVSASMTPPLPVPPVVQTPPLPVPPVVQTPPLPVSPVLQTPPLLTRPPSDMGSEAATVVEPKKLSLSRRLSAAREETALHGNLSPAAKPAAKGPPAVDDNAPAPKKATRRRSLSDRLKKPPSS